MKPYNPYWAWFAKASKMLPKYREELERLKHEKAGLEEELHKRFPKVNVPPELDQYSINLDLEAPTDLIDHAHHYSRLVYSSEIDYEGNYKARYERHGTRVVDGVTTALKIQTGASYPIRFAQLQMRAYNPRTGRQLKIEILDDDLYRKKYSIYLDTPVRKFDSFDVAWEFIWSHACAGEHDSDTINLAVFKRDAIDEMEHTLVFPFEIPRVLLQELPRDGRRLFVSDVQPTKREQKGKFYYSYTIKKPKVAGYLISWLIPGSHTIG